MEADESTSCVEFFRQSLLQRKLEVLNRAVLGYNSEALYYRTSYLHITLGTAKNATFSLRMASEAFISQYLSELHDLAR